MLFTNKFIYAKSFIFTFCQMVLLISLKKFCFSYLWGTDFILQPLTPWGINYGAGQVAMSFLGAHVEEVLEVSFQFSNHLLKLLFSLKMFIWVCRTFVAQLQCYTNPSFHQIGFLKKKFNDKFKSV